MTTLKMKEKKRLDELQRVYRSEFDYGLLGISERSGRMIVAVIFYR